MAYAIKYLFKFESSNGTTREIRVLQDGYTGEVIQRPLGRAPVLKKQQNGPVHGTSLEFYAECHVDREFIEFYTSDPKAYRVDLYAGATLLWQGYITPELYSEPDIAPPYDVQVVATDGVGELKLYDYAAQGTVTLRTLLSGLLSRTGLGTDIYLISSLKPGSAGAGSLLEKTINLDYMAGKTCYNVLTYVLDTLHATITWWKGAWILTRETNVTFTNGKVRYFNTAGNSALLNDSVQVLGKMYTNPAWPVGQLSTVIDPAKNKIEVQAPWHPVTCLQNPDMTSDASWTKINSASYDSTNGGYLLPFPQGGTGQIRQQISMAGLRVPMSISVRATASTSTISGQVVAPQLGVLLIYTVGNASYHLRKGSDGTPVWESGALPSGAIPAGTQVDFQQTLSIWDASRIEAEELKVENIPAFMQGGAFPAGTMTVYIIGYCATVFSAHLDVVLPKGYADILRLNNGARGEGDTVEIAIGRETADNAYYAAFLQGLLLDSGSLITSFSDANFTTGMDYLAFIARDYALSVALPRAKVTGTVFLEGSVQIPPLVFTKGGLDYWVETWGWNLYDDELEISAVTLPSASLTVQSETILESNGSTVSSAGGAGSSGSSMGGGGGTNYWEIDGTLNTLLKPKDAYSYVSSKDGLFFTGATLSGTVVPDLYVDTVNNQRVLRSPLPLITGGDQIVISGTPGGGGGGGATNLKELEDVYHNASGVRRYSSGNATSTDLLGYDSTKGWYAVQLGTGLSMTNGVLTASTGSTYTAGYAVSIAQSAISVAHTNEDTDPISFDPDTHTGLDASNLVEWGVSTHTDCAKLTIGVGSDSPVSKDVVLASGYDYLLGLINSQVAGVSSVAGKTGAVTLEIADVTGLQTALNGKQAAGNYLTSVPLATSSAIGGIQIGYTQSGKNYPVQLSSNKAYVYVPWENTTYSAATTSAAGLMSASDKSKLNGIAEGANNYSLPTASSSTLGGIKIGTGLTIDSSGVVSVTGQTVGTVTGISVNGGSKSPDSSGIITLDNYWKSGDSRTANTVLAAPNGSNGAATFRALVAADIPTLTKSKISDFPTNVSAFTNDAGYITSYTNTWRNVYTGGTSRVGTGTDTKAVNFAAGTGITISYKAAGTGSGQSGSNNYFNVEIGVTANTYQPLDADLTAIAALTGPSSGQAFLKRKSDNTWVLDTSTYLTSHQTLYNLVINNSAGTAQITYKPGTSGTYSLTLTKAMVGLGDVENTALSTWAGTTNITTLGTITSGTWSGSTIGVSKGGTGLTTWTGAYRIIYSTAATTLTTLAPNSTTTRKFLRQVGANNAATAPAWDTVTKTDVGLGNVPNWVYTIKDSSAQNFVN